MKRIIIALAAAAILLGGAGGAAAKTKVVRAAHAGRETHRSSLRPKKNHYGPHHKGKDFLVFKCKTASCFKKHPSGSYVPHHLGDSQ